MFKDYFHDHPEQQFILEALSLAVFLKALQSIFYIWWYAILILSPLLVFWLLQVIKIHQNKSGTQVLLENLTLIPAPYLDREEKYCDAPWVTYMLILINIFVYYAVIPHLSDTILGNLVFVPENPAFINTLVSMFSCMFLHGDNWHLWGNMAFLWAMGTVLERRIGHGWLIGGYLATGVAANLVDAVMGYGIDGIFPMGIGASGAITGLMGIFAVRCYFKTMVFPFPVLGLFAFIFPLSLKVRMNALVVVALFFWADLSYGLDQIRGIDTGNVAYWCHIGGFLSGIFLAYRMNLGGDAIQEKQLDTARTALSGKEWLDEETGEAAVRNYLADNPEDVEALLLLARKISQYRLPEEGRELYQKAILLILKSDLDEAVKIFKEYFDKYQLPLQASLQIRLAALIEKAGNLNFATRSLEMLLDKAELTIELKEKCLFHCARLCWRMGLDEAAKMYRQRME